MLYPRFEGSWACKRIDEVTGQVQSSFDEAKIDELM